MASIDVRRIKRKGKQMAQIEVKIYFVKYFYFLVGLLFNPTSYGISDSVSVSGLRIPHLVNVEVGSHTQ